LAFVSHTRYWLSCSGTIKWSSFKKSINSGVKLRPLVRGSPTCNSTEKHETYRAMLINLNCFMDNRFILVLFSMLTLPLVLIFFNYDYITSIPIEIFMG